MFQIGIEIAVRPITATNTNRNLFLRNCFLAFLTLLASSRLHYLSLFPTVCQTIGYSSKTIELGFFEM
jgi:hypothetical protein